MNKYIKQEIRRACLTQDKYSRMCYKAAYQVFKKLLKQGHSGMSICYTKQILNRMIDGKCLTPVRESDGWIELSRSISGRYTEYQSNRMSSLFKTIYDDGRIEYHDLDLFICVDKNNGFSYHNCFISKFLHKMFPIELPYYAPDRCWRVYTSDKLSNQNNGDYDCIEIDYAISPYDQFVKIEKYFKWNNENEEWEEITKDEYNEIGYTG